MAAMVFAGDRDATPSTNAGNVAARRQGTAGCRPLPRVMFAPTNRARSAPVKFRLASLTVTAVYALTACGTMHMPHVWPFYKKAKAGPVAVHELNLVNADGSPASYPQYWKRNALVIDLSGVSGAGNVA